MPNHYVYSNAETKIKEFKKAIERYKNNRWYVRVEIAASILVIALQLLTFIHLCFQYKNETVVSIILTFLVSYLLTDFINGFVHMLVDNSQQYLSIFGPYIAAFHIHHVKLNYESLHPIKIYFYESGHKFWLVGYLILLSIFQFFLNINFYINACLVAVGIFSSFSELSHFWCHNQNQANGFIKLLQKYGILLSMKHHKLHHKFDNMHYAFLNGMTDPLLNIIARRCFSGYKNLSDKDVSAYELNNKIK